MPMADQDLHSLLEQLSREIERTQDVDEKGRKLLRQVGSDVRELLAQSESVPIKPHPSRLQLLEDTIRHLEVTHPALTSMLSELLQTLSNAGI